jgi:putative CocE/NonD family hydrolase
MTSPISATTQRAARENSPPGRRLPWSARLFTRLSRRGLPPPVCGVRVAPGIEVPAADGVPLRTDHYIPQLTGPRPALLVRTPYGRGFPWAFLFGGLFAERGYHVIIQSCRGTGGSGGTFQPWRHERADGQATVAWLRQQDWFTGELATIGPSYLGYTQWALAADPPPELRAMIVQVGASAPYPLFYPGGAFALENMLLGVVAMRYWERGFGAVFRALLRLQTRIRRVTRTLPVLDAYPKATGGRIGYFEEWLTHPDAADPYWTSPDATSADAAAGGPVPAVPVSLLTGWQDICLDENLAEYRRLRAAGRTPRLVIGPWSHTSGFNDDLPVVVGEALDWLTAYCSKDPAGWSRPPVRVHVGGGRGEWRDLPDWPPPGPAGQLWRLAADGQLSAGPLARPGVSSFRYDPADPTPSVGGQLLSNKAGPVNNQALEARADVLVFTSPALAGDLEVIGPVSARLRVRASGPHFDVFARLCDVDPRGRSRNVCDGLIRHVPAAGAGEAADGLITVPMSATAYRFRAGHRLRLQVSGGAHPRFARNTGTGEPWATTTRLAAVDLEIVHDAPDPGGLSLPVLG